MNKEQLNLIIPKDYSLNNPISISNISPTHPLFSMYNPKNQLFQQNTVLNYDSKFCTKIMSTFYEILTSAITGGVWRGNKNSSFTDWFFSIDVLTKDEIIDSKGVCLNEKCALLDFQIDRYLLQNCNHVFMPSPEKIRYFIFKYNIDSSKQYLDRTKQGELVQTIISTLSQETNYLLSLPFSIIHSLHNPETKSEFTSRYIGDKWDCETRFLSSGMDKMLTAPEEILTLIGLDPSHFDIAKTYLPSGMNMNGFDIAPFPILQIKDKEEYYKIWLQELKEKNVNKLKKLNLERKTRDECRGKKSKLVTRSESYSLFD